MYMDRSVCNQERHGYEYVLHTELPLPDREAHYSKMLVIHQALGKIISNFLSPVERCHIFLLLGMVLLTGLLVSGKPWLGFLHWLWCLLHWPADELAIWRHLWCGRVCWTTLSGSRRSWWNQHWDRIHRGTVLMISRSIWQSESMKFNQYYLLFFSLQGLEMMRPYDTWLQAQTSSSFLWLGVPCRM